MIPLDISSNWSSIIEDTQTCVRYGFSHAIKFSDGATIYCAGQVSWDKDYQPVGEADAGAQARQALSNGSATWTTAAWVVATAVRLPTKRRSIKSGLMSISNAMLDALNLVPVASDFGGYDYQHAR